MNAKAANSTPKAASATSVASNQLLQRQCACGNHTASGAECSTCADKKLQRKLSIGASNDPLELEADRVADQVMAYQPAHSFSNISAPKIQRRAEHSSEKAGEVPASVEHVLEHSGRGLPKPVRTTMERSFNQDFSQVHVHTDSSAEKSAADINARAYTAGNHIVFGKGQFSPDTNNGQHLLAHELTHVIQQSGNSAQVMRAPLKSSGEIKREHQVDLDHLKEILVKILGSLSPKEQARIDRNGTVALALVEQFDEHNEPFTTMVYTANGNKNTLELENSAARFGVANIGATPRTEGRGETGAPGDAEQILSEAAETNGMKILGQAVSRPPCADCSEMIKAEDIKTTWLDKAARKNAFGTGRLQKNASGALKNALAEVDMAFMPAITAPGQEATAGLGPEAPLWPALNSLEIRELYKLLELQQHKGRLDRLQEACNQAKGIFKERLIAVMTALAYKKQLQSKEPSDSVLMGSYHFFIFASEKLPKDQQEYLNKTLQPLMRSIVKQRAAPKPKAEDNKTRQPKPEQKPGKSDNADTAMERAVKKGLQAAGLVISALVLIEIIEAVVAAFFYEVIMAAAAQTLKTAAQDKTREIIAREIRTRVKDISPQQVQKAVETVYHELEPFVEGAAKAIAH